MCVCVCSRMIPYDGFGGTRIGPHAEFVKKAMSQARRWLAIAKTKHGTKEQTERCVLVCLFSQCALFLFSETVFPICI